MRRPRLNHGFFVKEWNDRYPVGTPVLVKMDDGSERQTRTRTPASVLEGHTGVVWLEGISGCYLLTRVRAVGEDYLA